MPLPVAHGLLGASVAAALRPPSQSRRWGALWAGAFLGICPDFDYALNWLRISGGGWHHGFTHSILFALSLGSLTAAVSGGGQGAKRHPLLRRRRLAYVARLSDDRVARGGAVVASDGPAV
jgi:hypothetical protein